MKTRCFLSKRLIIEINFIYFFMIMSNKKVKEWSIDVPWGKVALIAWGNSNCSPMLLIHGYMDTAATHTFLVNLLPDTYYYVGFDIPGHGKSDPYPEGISINPLHVVEVIRRIVQHMKWKTFILMAHSLGCLVGILYHHIYPAYIHRMIFLDPVYPLTIYYLVQDTPDIWFNNTYSDYYDQFQKWNPKEKVYTYEKAINLFTKFRDLTEEQAKVIISRSLIPVGPNLFKLSWEIRAKKFSFSPLDEETMFEIMSEKVPPTICIDASKSFQAANYIVLSDNMLKRCEETIPHFYRVTVTGGHDYHITNPEIVVPIIKKFLDNNEASYPNVFTKKCNL